MWNKRKEEEYTPRPVIDPPFPHATPDAEPEPPPPPAAPPRAMHPEPTRGSAMIGKSVSIRGQITSREDLTIDGEVEGTIEAQEHRVIIGPNGRVRATVKAREVLILGQLFGNVEAGDKAEIRRDAKLVGDVRTTRIAIEDGAWFKGSIDIVRQTEAPKIQPRPGLSAGTPAPGAVLPPVVITTPAPGSADSAPAEVKL